MGLVGGTPTYLPVEGFSAPDVPARAYHYSPDGRLFAYTLPSMCVLPRDRVINLPDFTTVCESFSPKVHGYSKS